MSYHEVPRDECSICLKVFHNRADLREHIVRIHENRKYSCQKCGKVFTSRRSLHHHLNIHAETYQCFECKRSFSRQKELNFHLETHMGKAPCNNCGKSFIHVSAHEAKCGKPRVSRVACPVCGKLFKERRYLSHHLANTHKSREQQKQSQQHHFMCECKKKFKRRDLLHNHMQNCGKFARNMYLDQQV